MTLYTKDGSVKAHKLVLASISPYFYNLFKENKHEHPYILLYGVSFKCLQYLIEVIYYGNSNVPHDDLEAVYQLATEFGVFEHLINSASNDVNFSQTSPTESLHNRDTRYKGQKRVAVDFQDFEEGKENNFDNLELQKSVQNQQSPLVTEPIKEEVVTPVSDSTESFIFLSGSNNMAPKLNAWARKQRKFKCSLCSSSFKRASHLSRHQLVHTGERPYACNQCDKAFSRHDKLKHHIRKSHMAHTEVLVEDYDPLETNSSNLCLSDASVRVQSPTSSDISIKQDNFLPKEVCPTPELSPLDLGLRRLDHSSSAPICKISNVASLANGDVFTPPVKKGRGRPRKHTPISTPNPLVIKRGRGRPRIHPANTTTKVGNYDITNLPFGDLDLLTNSFENNPEDAGSAMDIPEILEPLVEIQTEQQFVEQSPDKSNNEPQKSDDNFIGRIGQCTVTLEGNNGNSETVNSQDNVKEKEELSDMKNLSSKIEQVVKIGDRKSVV